MGPSLRLPVLDGLRGVFLVMMTLGHLRLAEHGLGLLHPAQISFVHGAFGFVLLSGIVAGLVYGRLGQRLGLPAMTRRTTRRAATLALTATGLVVGLIVAARLAPEVPVNWAPMLGPLAHADAGALAAGALHLQHIDYADILPQYVLYMLAAPLVIWAVLRGRVWIALSSSGALWAAAQFGGADPAVDGIRAVLGALGDDLYPPRMFNVLAWQLLFVAGIVLGAVTMLLGPESWRRSAALDSRPLLWLSLSIVAVLAAVNLSVHLGLPALETLPSVSALVAKERLGLITLINAAAVSWLIAWFYGVAPGSRHAFTRVCGGLMRWLLHAPVLRLLGRHSLLTYLWQVVLIYAVEAAVVRPEAVPEPFRSLAVLLVLASLALPALLREAVNRRRASAPVGAAASALG